MVKREYNPAKTDYKGKVFFRNKAKRKEASSRSKFHLDREEGYDRSAWDYYGIAAQYLENDGSIKPEYIEAYEKALKQGDEFHDAGKKAFHVAVRYRRIAQGKKPFESSGLERTTITSIIAIAGIISGIFLLSPNVTGNVVGNMTNSTSNILGTCLLFVGLIAGFFSLKRLRSLPIS